MSQWRVKIGYEVQETDENAQGVKHQNPNPLVVGLASSFKLP